jgi:GTP pyrophosphokinase
MKTAPPGAAEAAAIVHLLEPLREPPATGADSEQAQLARARAFAEPLLIGQVLDTGEPALAHAHGVAGILQDIGAAPSMCGAAYLVYAGDYLNKPEEVVNKAFGPSYASLVSHTRRLVQIQRAARRAQVLENQQALQTERVRKMLLAFSHDLRVVLLRLASRLQTLRFFAASKTSCPSDLAQESMLVFAPLANRLGIWQIKWELEDLAFRFSQPDRYKEVAGWLAETRVDREQQLEQFRQELQTKLLAVALNAEVQARPKHLYSIWKKMQGKQLQFSQVFDVRAMRVIVPTVADCYAVLSRVHEWWTPVLGEFDDYIAKPKPNGYQSLHTVVNHALGRPVEVQIRTRVMHEHAEHGVAAHWAYKESGVKGYAGVSAAGDFDAQVAEARKAVLRQLLAWEHELSHALADTTLAAANGQSEPAVFDDRIYVFTPQAAVVELAAGSTPLDFAYAVHTDLGHRCRGAKVDGAMVPLNTPLQSGQTVEVTALKEGGPSLDWLNTELAYLGSHRARAKVRAWFNAQAQAQTVARGREAVEKLLQREGKTALKFDDLAAQLGFQKADALFEVVGKDELSLRTIENLLRPPEPVLTPDEVITLRKNRSHQAAPQGGVLVVGVESLLTGLARCCRPAPPDAIGGYVTRGKGVAVHRRDCVNFVHMAETAPERVIAVAWGAAAGAKAPLYPVDVVVEAADRQGLLRDISEVFAKEKMNVIGVNTHSVRDTQGHRALMTFTIEVQDAARLAAVLRLVAQVSGVRSARRR